MNEDYDFSQAERGPVAPLPTGKTRITIRLDNEIVAWFKQRVHEAGGGSYQALINAALREQIRSTEEQIQGSREPLEETFRRVLREELRRAG